ncbi:lysophospholipid acyltransferase family protein [Corynebacterium kroppenstedtii]|jgi:1-acyl-sn-glycerol-3-phosphate acyltransferase|uniref:1-acyl-sn-glycerol-3-phosphate acyltransferase n=1 Tax=Corynebacterium kroppenstedtii TaxID=161879 RepID=A0A2W5UPG7_9CORY|nr:lysophospholipid acyltransferase family protein [Corynebacterium kroppenstedtii]MDU7287269.1 lysophospholipid acyltransferase family protein [Corynebacterium kroppenstedtii]PZR05174.1 MAG: 1-acyl-sn-glycerol-3-phosphate acyltransferase [Corynebacterium kroppenstedtii]
MHNRWYWTFKYILFGPFLRVWNRPFTKNIDRIPSEGPAILASNHLSVMDSFYLPLLCPRQITFLAKSEYFTTPGLVGRIQAWFFSSVGQYPIDRSSGQAAQDALNAGLKVVGRGDLMGMYPEGTRSPDGRLYRGKTGIARLAFESGQKVYPVAMINTRKANPIGSLFPRPVRVGVSVGEPLDPLDYMHIKDEYERLRTFTDDIMESLHHLGGQEYVHDFYAADVKAALNEGKGYLRGSEPK